MQQKLVSRKKIQKIARHVKREGRRIVFTNGCFDVLHLGHVRYLAEARTKGDLLIVGLNSDMSVRRLKGPGRPLVPQRDRAEILSSLEMVDYVVIFHEDTPARLIAEIAPDILVKGADYTTQDVAGRDTVEASGGRVVLIPLVRGRSTTGLISKIHSRTRGRRARRG